MDVKFNLAAYTRVLKMASTPSKDEFFQVAGVAGAGITLIGFIGFVIFAIMRLLPA